MARWMGLLFTSNLFLYIIMEKESIYLITRDEYGTLYRDGERIEDDGSYDFVTCRNSPVLIVEEETDLF